MTKNDFIEKARKVHGNKYDYSKIPDTFKYKDKILIICNIHGEFYQIAGNHLCGGGCPICGKIKRNKQYGTEEFIHRAREIYGDMYDYSKVNYIDSKTKVCIIDKEKGEFWQIPNSHLQGHKLKITNTITTNDFIKKARDVHGNKYDYSKSEYKNCDTKITIICPIHGEFQQTPYNHLKSQGCPFCGGTHKLSTDDFIKKARDIHGDKYDYSNVEYIDNKTKVPIECKTHGIFWQTPGKHLIGRGCPICGNIKRSKSQLMTTDEFISIARNIHGDKYDYSKVDYKGYDNYVEIGCKIHGFFKQTPDSHLHSGGCPKCGATLSKNEDELFNILCEKIGTENIEQRNRSILSNRELDIYIPKKKIAIEYDGLYWHSDMNERIDKNYHLNKTLLCDLNGIRLIHVFEDEYINHKDIVLNKLYQILGINSDKEKIMARKCQIKEITKTESETFLNKYHIQGFVRGTIHLGAFYESELIGVMSFTKAYKDSNNWELTRFATNYNYICQGVGGKLFKYFIRKYNPEEIKSFADRRWSSNINNVYTKLGFNFDGYTKPDYSYYRQKDGVARQHKFNFRKQILNRKYGFPLTMTEDEMVKELGCYKIWNCGLIKYIWKK